jgi:hypothetical protein
LGGGHLYCLAIQRFRGVIGNGKGGKGVAVKIIPPKIQLNTVQKVLQQSTSIFLITNKMKLLYFHALLILAANLYAQPNQDRLRDSKWLFGYGTENVNPAGGNMLIDFLGDTMQISTLYTDMNFQETNASICDTLGNLLFYTNGRHIRDQSHQIMAGWDTLNPGGVFANEWFNSGYTSPQGALILPQPGSDSLYYLFHSRYSIYQQFDQSVLGDYLYYTLVNIHGNNGLGEIIDLNHELVADYLDYGKINACRHANGRDWWIIMTKFDSPSYYSFLLDPAGVHNMGLISGSSNIKLGLGQSVFSPDGSKYAVFHGYDFVQGSFLYVYNFDRCTGLLEEIAYDNIIDTASCAGAAMSPNSRYLYLPSGRYLYQYDLLASDIVSSKTTVAVWDGFMDWDLFATTFYLAQLAPNGKIYISSNTSVRYLHVIEQPDSAGLACNVAQHGLQLPHFSAYTMPHFPNFRLGSQPNSSCDTLGIAPGVSTALPPPPIVPPRVGVLQASPNPARDVCHLSFGSVLVRGGTLRVHDLRGRQVEALPLSTASIGCTLDVRTWAAGIYIASLYNDLGVLLGTVKVVKA